MSKFDIRKFLTENKLTDTSKRLDEKEKPVPDKVKEMARGVFGDGRELERAVETFIERQDVTLDRINGFETYNEFSSFADYRYKLQCHISDLETSNVTPAGKYHKEKGVMIDFVVYINIPRLAGGIPGDEYEPSFSASAQVAGGMKTFKKVELDKDDARRNYGKIKSYVEAILNHFKD